jgi:hypothetical protein
MLSVMMQKLSLSGDAHNIVHEVGKCEILMRSQKLSAEADLGRWHTSLGIGTFWK